MARPSAATARTIAPDVAKRSSANLEHPDDEAKLSAIPNVEGPSET